MTKIIFFNPVNPALQVLSLPTGEKLWVSSENAAAVKDITEFENQTPATASGGSTVLFIRLGAGFHHFYNIPHLGRQVWFTKGAVRPYDENKLKDSLDKVKALVVEERVMPLSGTRPNPCALIEAAPFSAELCSMLKAGFVPMKRIENGYWLFAAKS